MASERIEWKLAAIAEADVAGGRRRGHARAAARQTSQALARLHQLPGFGEAKPLESLGREFKGRHYTGSEGSGGRAEGRGRDFWWGLGGEVELQALQQE